MISVFLCDTFADLLSEYFPVEVRCTDIAVVYNVVLAGTDHRFMLVEHEHHSSSRVISCYHLLCGFNLRMDCLAPGQILRVFVLYLH